MPMQVLPMRTRRIIRSERASGFCIPLRARYRVLPRDGSVRTTKTSRVIARAMARGLGFVTPCPNKQCKNAYLSKVSDASGTASDVVNVRKDCKYFGPPLWVVLVEERGPFVGPS